MLLPDNIKPENSIYYTGSVILKSLQTKGNQSLDDLFSNVNMIQCMSFKVFMFSLDWLFLLNAAVINDEEVQLCI